MNEFLKEFKQKTAQSGMKVTFITFLLLVALIGANLLFGLLPARFTKFDITAEKMYSVSTETKRAVSKIKNDIDIYLLSSTDESKLTDEGLHLKTFLDNLAGASGKLHFSVVNTVTNPTFATQLGLEDAGNLSVVVKSGDRVRLIPYSDIFFYYIDGLGQVTEQEAYYYSMMYQVSPEYRFGAENRILSAIDFVTAEHLPTVYTLTGHSEAEISPALTEQFESLNVSLKSLTLLVTGSVPLDCELLVINLPDADLTENEAAALADYLESGGKLILITAPGVSGFKNLLSVTEKYGMGAEDGIVIEGNSQYYYQVPYYLFPGIVDHSITREYSSSQYPMLPFAHGITIADSNVSDARVSQLFVTSSSAYIVNVNAETTECPDGQEPAVHTLGAISETDSGSAILWIASEGITNDSVNASFSAGANYVYLMSAVKYFCGAKDSVYSIAPVPLSTARLVVPTAAAGLWSLLLIIVVPIAVFVAGLVYWLKRRRR